MRQQRAAAQNNILHLKMPSFLFYLSFIVVNTAGIAR